MVLCENPECVSKERLGRYLTSLPLHYMRQIAEANLLATSAASFLDVERFCEIRAQSIGMNLSAGHPRFAAETEVAYV